MVAPRWRAKKKLNEEELFEDLLARTLGYASALRMHEDLTAEEYDRWRRSYQQAPWGEEREDQRNTVLLRWLMEWLVRAGLLKVDEPLPDPPNTTYPYFVTPAEREAQEIAEQRRLEQRAQEDLKRLKAKRGN